MAIECVESSLPFIVIVLKYISTLDWIQMVTAKCGLIVNIYTKNCSVVLFFPLFAHSLCASLCIVWRRKKWFLCEYLRQLECDWKLIHTRLWSTFFTAKQQSFFCCLNSRWKKSNNRDRNREGERTKRRWEHRAYSRIRLLCIRK